MRVREVVFDCVKCEELKESRKSIINQSEFKLDQQMDHSDKLHAKLMELEKDNAIKEKLLEPIKKKQEKERARLIK